MTGKRRATGATAPPKHAPGPAGTPRVSLADRLGEPSLPERAPAPRALRPAPTPLPVGTRQEQRRERQLAARRKWRVVGIASALVVVIVGAALAIPALFAGSGGVTGVATAGRTQQTLTMVVAAQGSPATSGALIGTDQEQGNGSLVLVPSRVVVDGPTPDGVLFGSTATLPDPNAPGFALAQTLAVVVDGTWSLTPAGLTSLVDSVGGVTVTIDADVVVRQPDGSTQVLVPAGTAKLTGAQATAYATIVPVAGQEQARLAHFDEVLQALVALLPSDPTVLQKQLSDLGAQSEVTKGDAWLAAFLVSLQSAIDNGDVLAQNLPVESLEAGTAIPIYTVDDAASEQVINQNFADSRPPGGTNRPNVLVQNGVGRPGLVESAAAKLTAGGFAFVNGGNANRFGYDKTVVVVPDSSVASVDLGAAVAKSLGVPSAEVQVAAQGQTVAEVIVVLGADFKP
jgi:hypothetical protein